MKSSAKTFCVCILLLSFGILAAAPAKANTVKLLAGLSFGNLRYSQSDLVGPGIGDMKKFRQGFFAGIGFETHGKMGLEVDILYLQKGMKNEGTWNLDGHTAEATIDTVIDEISVPIMFRLNLMENTGIYFLGGGEVAYILSAKSKYSYSVSGGESGEGTEDLLESFNSFDYGLIGGAGFGFNRRGGGFGFYIEGRYHYGLANLVKQTDAAANNGSVKADAIVLMIGLIF